MLPVSLSSLSPVYQRKSVASTNNRSRPESQKKLRIDLTRMLNIARSPLPPNISPQDEELRELVKKVIPEIILSLGKNNTDNQVLEELQETAIEATLQVLKGLANQDEMLQALVESQTAQSKSLANANNKAKQTGSFLNTLLLGIGLSGALAVAVNSLQPKLFPSLLAQIPKLELDQKAVASEHIPICPIKNCKDKLPEKGGSGDYGVVTKLRNGRAHTGLDFGAPTGTSVIASVSGKIVVIDDKLCGKGVVIYGLKYVISNCHLSEVLVENGQEVKQGEEIGKVGSTGHSTGPHLHFGMKVNGEWVNPRYEIQYDPAKPNTDIDLKPVPPPKQYNEKNNIVPKPAQPSKKVGKSK